MSEVPLPDLELGGGEEVERLRDGALGAVQGLGFSLLGSVLFRFRLSGLVLFRPRCCSGFGFQAFGFWV